MKTKLEDLPPFNADEVKADIQEQKPEENPAYQKAVVVLNEYGVPAPKNIDEAYRVAEAMYKGGAFPKWVRSPIQALAVSQYCRSLGLDPMVGIQHTCEVNGRLALYGEGPLAAVRGSGKLEWIEERFLDAQYKEICAANKNLDAELFAAICIVKRVGSRKHVERFFTLEDEKTAMKGLPNVWKGYKRIMYKRKARAEALKDEFGDVLGGATIAEYDFSTAPDTNPEIVEPSLADKLNAIREVEIQGGSDGDDREADKTEA